MDPERWQRLDGAFHAALTLPSDERMAFVARLAGEDAELARELEQLLAAHDGTGFDSAAAARLATTIDEVAPSSHVGRRFGPYLASAEIGRGGMGTVLLAERIDGQFTQRVAIKLIQRGLNTDQILERFRVERQILASLEHPHIARLLDGGTTDDGQPFFVMEAIEGEPIDVWCDERRLSVRARIELFLQVCDAVSHAHRHLIVHRDIKPQNILVTREGTPKLLDFGIAKAIQANGESEPVTIGPGPMLTPDYASPEQIDGRPTTTSTDVYSLGVVLYELLTGRSPYRPRSWSVSDLSASVRTTEVERPSTAVGRQGLDGRGRVRAPRHADRATATDTGTLERLRAQLAGDLDAIVLTALAKEPERRYASVEQLADDLRQHLAGRPVRAREAGLGYRAMKFAQRNRVAVTAAALVALTLVASTIFSARQAREARRQAEIARSAHQAAERRFAEVRRLANTVLFDYHDAIKDLPGATPVRERLVRDALEALERLDDEAGEDPTLRREVAVAYRKVAEVQGGSSKSSLGDTAGAIASNRKGLAILESIVAAAPGDLAAQRDLVDLSAALVVLEMEAGDLSQALAHAQRARAAAEVLLVEAPPDGALRLTLARADDALGTLLQESGRLEEALAVHLRQTRLLESAPAAERRDPRLRRSLSIAHHHLADVQAANGDLAGALESHRRSLAVREALWREFPLNTDYRRLMATSHFYLGDLLAQSGRTQEALAELRQALAIGEELAAADPQAHTSDLAYTLVQIGAALIELDDPAAAVPHLRRARDIREADVRGDPESLWKLASLVDSDVRLCGALVTLRSSDAPAECARAVKAAEALSIDPADATYRTFLADSYAALGDAHAALGTNATALGAPEDSSTAVSTTLYRKSLEIYRDLGARGILAAADAEKPEAVARALAAAEAEPVS